MSLLDQAKAASNITLILKGISKVCDIESKQCREEIEKLYNEKESKAYNLMATIINSSITDNKPCFMMSRNTLVELVKSDTNQYNSKTLALYPRDYKELLMRMMQSKPPIFECLNNPSIKKGKGIAGLYRVKSPDLRQYYTDIETQELKIIEEYCLYQNIPLIKIED